MMWVWRVRLCLAAAFGAAFAALPAPSYAGTPFDGRWSVLIITDRGTCDRAYRYAVRIDDGVVRYGGDASFDLSGHVTRNGRVKVQIVHGSQRANGTGRMTRDSGAGTWVGRSSADACSGRWEAERRG